MEVGKRQGGGRKSEGDASMKEKAFLSARSGGGEAGRRNNRTL